MTTDAMRPMCDSTPRTDDEPWEPWEGNGPCQDCGGRNVVWVAPNHIWNSVMQSSVNKAGVGFLCPNCFIVRAFYAGHRVVWSLHPEDNDAYWHARADEREKIRRDSAPSVPLEVGTP